MIFPKLLLAVLLATAASASPVSSSSKIANSACAANPLYASTMSRDPSATSFCSCLLGIGTQTFFTTVTTTIPVATTSMTSYASTSTVTQPAVTSTVIVTTTTTTCSPTAVHKRAATSLTSSHTSVTTCSTPAAYTTQDCSSLSQACSCMSLTSASTTLTYTATSSGTVTATVSLTTTTTQAASTTTVTSTSTSVVNSCPTPSSCNNAGLQYGLFYNDQGDDTSHPTYSNFNPVYMKAQSAGGEGNKGNGQLKWNGTTNSIGGIDYTCSSPSINVYDDPNSIPCNYFALNHRGYLYAPVAGTYTFYVSGVDDIVFFWTGSTAISGWTRDNAAANVGYGSPNNSDGPGSGQFSLSLTQGQYLPIRIIFGQASGPATFQLSLTDPNGDTILSSKSGSSPYVIQYSCDGKLAPAFPNSFGQET